MEEGKTIVTSVPDSAKWAHTASVFLHLRDATPKRLLGVKLSNTSRNRAIHNSAMNMKPVENVVLKMMSNGYITLLSSSRESKSCWWLGYSIQTQYSTFVGGIGPEGGRPDVKQFQSCKTNLTHSNMVACRMQKLMTSFHWWRVVGGFGRNMRAFTKTHRTTARCRRSW